MKNRENRRQFPVGVERLAIGMMLVFVLALGLMLGMTGAAKADIDAGELYVAGVDITTQDNYTVRGSSGTAVLTNGDNPVLTLTNFTYEGSSIYESSIIYMKKSTSNISQNLTIELIGNNVISNNDNSVDAIRLESGSAWSITIQGPGSLTTGNRIYIGGTFTMDSGNLKVISGAAYGLSLPGTFTFRGGTLEATGNSHGLYVYNESDFNYIADVDIVYGESENNTSTATSISDYSDYNKSAKYVKITAKPHVHNFTYEASDGNTITATCGAEGCPLDDGNGNHTATLIIGAPTLTAYGQTGESISAHATITDPNSIQGSATVSYFATDTDGNKTGNALTPAPTDAGTYWAEITLGSGDDSATANVVYTIAKATPAAITAETAKDYVTIDYTNETATANANSGYQLATTNAAGTQGSASISLTAILDGAQTPPTYYVRTAETDNYLAGSWVAMQLSARPAAPTNLSVDNASNPVAQDGAITGTDQSMEYRADGDQVVWTDATNDKTIVKAGTYLVRYKADANNNFFAGKTATVTVGLSYVALTDTAPAVAITKAQGNTEATVPQIGDTLTAATTPANANPVTYQWYRGKTAIEGANASTYVVATDDYNNALHVVVTQAANADGSNSAEVTATSADTAEVRKKDGPAAPADTAVASFSPDYSAETFTVGDAYEVSASQSDEGVIVNGTLTGALDSADHKVYIRARETNDTQAGAWLAMTLATRPDAPSPLTTESATNEATEDGRIKGTTDLMEYKNKTEGAEPTSWTLATNDATSVKSGTYLVRVKATNSAPHGVEAEVTVGSKYVALTDNTAVTIKKGEDAIGQTAPVVDDVLTVSCGASDLVYAWFVDGEPKGEASATNTSYTVQAADVGKTVTVKAYQTKDANGTEYQQADRPTKEAATTAVVKKTPAALTADEAKTNSGINYIAETVTPSNGYEISSSNTEYAAVTSLTAILDGSETPTIYVRRAETADTAAGEWVAVTLTARPAAPTGLKGINATDGATANGAISGTSDSMEYKLKNGEGAWQQAGNDNTDGLAENAYLVRVKATNTAPAGKAAEVTVGNKEIILSDAQKPTAVSNLVYNGSKQELIKAPAEALPDGAVEMQYAIGTNATTAPTTGYTTSIPSKTDAGTYYVWYKTAGDNDHNDSEAACVTATIGQASITDADVTLSSTSLEYTGDQQSVTVSSVKLGEKTLTAGTDYEVTGGTTGSDRGSYTATVAGKGNYKGTVTTSWSIGLATPVISTVPTASAITYGQMLKDSTLTGGAPKQGDVTIEGTFSWKNSTLAPAVSDSGKTEYDVVFTPADQDNYATVACKVKLTVNKAKAVPVEKIQII